MQPFKRDQIRNEVSQLQGNVLTFYLNTNLQTDEWKIRLKNGLKKTEEYHNASTPEATKEISKIIKNINVKVRDHQKELANSLVCFASIDEVLLYPFQFPVNNDFIWSDKPETEQLEELFEKYLRTGLVLLQFDRITLLTASLGELVDEAHFEIDFDKEDWRPYKGLAFGGVISSSANHRHKFERRIKENQERWYKNIVPTIEKYAKNQGWKSIHLVGTGELTNHMKKQLNRDIDSEINRNFAGKSANNILARTIYTPIEE